jgi:phosphate transport system protein
VERHQFETELELLRGCVAEMGRVVQERTELAIGALLGHQAEPAVQVIEGDDAVNALQIEIDERALRLLALQAPAARDLRLVVATIKANADLERIGDQAVNIAETTQRLNQMPSLPQEALIERMGRLAVAMTRDAVASFLGRDAVLAREVLMQDDEVDRLKDEALRELTAAMTQDPACIERAIGLVFVSRNLERVADHATNMAEDAIFLVEAKDVRHHHE